MNLIRCDLDCKHQRDGYCGLDSVSNIKCPAGKCAYCETDLAIGSAGAKMLHRFPDISDTDHLYPGGQ